MLSCQAALPVMRDQGAGSIVNISSIAALAAATRLTAYKLSKAAINALGQSLAIDNAAHGIRVNTIMPGLARHADGGRRARRAQRRPA